MKRILIAVIFLFLMGLTGWAIYQNTINKAAETFGGRPHAAVAVETAPIALESIRDIGSFTGALSPRAQFVVAPKVGGRLERLLVNIGDHVQPGEVIAVLDDDEYEKQIEQARAELEVAKANLQESRSALRNARREFERVKVLRQKKIASESDLDAAEAKYLAQEAKYKVGLAQIAQKEAALKAAEVRLSYTLIQADWENNGSRVVGERFVDEGAMLGAHDPIASILDIRTLIAVVHVIERDYNKIGLGQKALITTDAFSGRIFQGKVIRIAPLIREQSRQARVEIEIPNPKELLKPGMFVRVRIEFAEHDNATIVPVAALVKRDGRQGVFLIDFEQSEALFVPVSLGVVEGDRAQVIDPPLSGSVVTLGQHLLSDGSSVILPESQKQSPASNGVDASHSRKLDKPGGSS